MGIGKAEPILIIGSRKVRLVVEARISGLFPEVDVTAMGLYSHEPMPHLPAPHQFVQVAGCQLFGILMHDIEQVLEDLERLIAGLIVGHPSGAILIGCLHEPHGKAVGLYVFRIDVNSRSIRGVFQEEPYRLIGQVYKVLCRLLKCRRKTGFVVNVLA